VAATLAAGAALGVGALQMAAPGPGTPSAAVADAAPTGVDVRRGNTVGRSADEVEDALVAAGLRVTRGTQESADAAPGTVLAVTPVGLLAPGELVTLTVAVASPSPPPTVAAPPPAAPSRSPSPVPSRGPSGWPSSVRDQVSSAPGQAQAVDAGSVASEAPPPATAPDTVEPGTPAPPEPAPAPEDDGTDDGGNGNAGGNGNGNAGGNGNGNGNAGGNGNGRGGRAG
jgi:serine/threonine-protein kinase